MKPIDRKRYKCSFCGSENLTFRTLATWDVREQVMKVYRTEDDGRDHWCDTCGKSLSSEDIDEVPVWEVT